MAIIYSTITSVHFQKNMKSKSFFVPFQTIIKVKSLRSKLNYKRKTDGYGDITFISWLQLCFWPLLCWCLVTHRVQQCILLIKIIRKNRIVFHLTPFYIILYQQSKKDQHNNKNIENTKLINKTCFHAMLLMTKRSIK